MLIGIGATPFFISPSYGIKISQDNPGGVNEGAMLFKDSQSLYFSIAWLSPSLTVRNKSLSLIWILHWTNWSEESKMVTKKLIFQQIQILAVLQCKKLLKLDQSLGMMAFLIEVIFPFRTLVSTKARKLRFSWAILLLISGCISTLFIPLTFHDIRFMMILSWKLAACPIENTIAVRGF